MLTVGSPSHQCISNQSMSAFVQSYSRLMFVATLGMDNFDCPGPAAMIRPVRPWPYRFLRGVAWILTYACVIEWHLRAVRRSLHGTSKRSSSDFFKSSSIQSIEERIEASQFSMAILSEHETSAQIGEGLTWASCVAVISGSSVQSLL